MTGPGHFEPIFPAHAIERCTASVLFHEAIPGKVMQRLRDRAAPVAGAMGLDEAFEPASFGIPINLVPNQLIRLDAAGLSGIARFASSDGGLGLTMSSNALVWQTTSYVRWAPFIGQFEELVAPLVEQVTDIVPISVVKLEYLDRFFWTGEWENIDYGQLLGISSDLVAHRGSKAQREWHSHVGWFHQLADRRRLLNVNLDVFAMPRGEEQVLRPTVGIFTMAQDQALAEATGVPPTWAEGERVADVLEGQHHALKELLAGVITNEAANEIGLRSAP